MIGRKKGAIFPWSLIFNIIFKFGANNIIYSFHFYAIKNVEIIGDTRHDFLLYWNTIETIELMDKPQN